MPETLPKLLPEQAMRLRANWKKAHGYFAAFATLWYELQNEFATGKYDAHRNELQFRDGTGSLFELWAIEAGLSPSTIPRILKAHFHALAAEHREKVERDNILAAQQRRQQREQHQAEIARRKASKAAQKIAPAIIDKVTPETANKHPASATPERGCQQCGISLAGKISTARFCSDRCRKAHYRDHPPRDQKRERFRTNPPLNAICAAALDRCCNIHESNQIALGEQYAIMRDQIRRGLAGSRDEHGHTWSWEHWQKIYIVDNPNPFIRKSKRTIAYCIAAFEKHSMAPYDLQKSAGYTAQLFEVFSTQKPH